MFSLSFPQKDHANIIRQLCQRLNVYSLDAYGITGITINSESCIVSFIDRPSLFQFRLNLNCSVNDPAHKIKHYSIILKKHINLLHDVLRNLYFTFYSDNNKVQIETFYKKIRNYKGLQEDTYSLIFKVRGYHEISQRKFFTISSPTS